jgi:signal transduction histidine kinase
MGFKPLTRTRLSYLSSMNYLHQFGYDAGKLRPDRQSHKRVIQGMADTLSLALQADQVTYYDYSHQWRTLSAHTANLTTQCAEEILGKSHVKDIVPEGPLAIALQMRCFVYYPTITQPNEYFIYDRNGHRQGGTSALERDNPLNGAVIAEYMKNYGSLFKKSGESMDMLFGSLSVPGTDFGVFKIDSFRSGRSVLQNGMHHKDLLQIAAHASTNASWIIHAHSRMMELEEERANAQTQFEQARGLLMEVKHAFNNRLGPLRGYVGLALSGRKVKTTLKKILDLMKETEQYVDRFVEPVQRGSFVSEVNRAPVDLKPMLEQFAEYGLKVDICKGLPEIETDVNAVYNIILGLIDNAKKYSENGNPIRIVCHFSKDKVEISVIDKGYGLANGDAEKIFDGGIRKHPHLSGSGYGLNGYRRTAEKLGGTLTATSPGLGEGSTFTLTLPI